MGKKLVVFGGFVLVKNKKNRHKRKVHVSSDRQDVDEISLDLSSFKEKSLRFVDRVESFSKKKFFLPVWIALLIVVVMFLSIYVRMGPLNLPIADQWATNAVESNYKNSFAQQVISERPNLPRASVERLVDEQYVSFYNQNRGMIDSQIKDLSSQYSSRLQNEHGMTYLLGIDEYYFYSHAKWFVRNGHFGTDIVDGESKFMLRRGRFGVDAHFMTHPFLIASLYKAWKPFNPDFNVEWAAFYIAVVLIALSAIPLFFLARRIGGVTGGFIASVLVLTAVPLVARTMAGAPDDDVHTFLFPFIMVALLFNAINKKTKTVVVMAVLAALANAIFMITWSGWWSGYLLVLGSSLLFLVYEFVRFKFVGKSFSRAQWVNKGSFFVVFFVFAIIFAMLISPLARNTSAVDSAVLVLEAPFQPLNLILRLGAGADVGVGGDYALWPNVLRTVAELNPASIKQIVNGPGALPLGKANVLFFYLGLAGIISLFLRFREDPAFVFFGMVLLVWLFGMVVISKSAVRFILMVSIPTMLGVGALIGALLGPVSNWLSNRLNFRKSVFVVVLSLILVLWFLSAPVARARAMSEGNIPIFDDAWYDSIYALKADAERFDERAIVSSWWDYGHFFQAYGEQSVTFDGADQGMRIYWMGRSLLTDDPSEALDILKVMNCGQEETYNLLEELIGDRFKATDLKLRITRLSREDARLLLLEYLGAEDVDSVLALSHCDDLRPMYFVTSGDMVGKAPVWAHFGGWNFTKAYFYYYLKNLPLPVVFELAEENIGLSEESARALYTEARLFRSEDAAAQWISPFISYGTREKVGCSLLNGSVSCEYNLALQQDSSRNLAVVLVRAVVPLDDLSDAKLVVQTLNTATGTPLSQEVIVPGRVVVENNGVFDEFSFDEPGIGFDLLLMYDGSYSSMLTPHDLTKSVFNRLFFMEGRGDDLSMFVKVSDVTSFRGERIIIWRVEP